MVSGDLRRLSASFPHVPGLRRVNNVLELTTLARKAYPSQSKIALGSLARLTALSLGYRLGKEQQVSDWTQRPLSSEQVTKVEVEDRYHLLLSRCNCPCLHKHCL